MDYLCLLCISGTLCFYFFHRSRFEFCFHLFLNYFPHMYLKSKRLKVFCCMGSMTVQYLLVSNLCYFSIPYLSLLVRGYLEFIFLFMDLPYLYSATPPSAIDSFSISLFIKETESLEFS